MKLDETVYEQQQNKPSITYEIISVQHIKQIATLQSNKQNFEQGTIPVLEEDRDKGCEYNMKQNETENLKSTN